MPNVCATTTGPSRAIPRMYMNREVQIRALSAKSASCVRWFRWPLYTATGGAELRPPPLGGPCGPPRALCSSAADMARELDFLSLTIPLYEGENVLKNVL